MATHTLEQISRWSKRLDELWEAKKEEIVRAEAERAEEIQEASPFVQQTETEPDETASLDSIATPGWSGKYDDENPVKYKMMRFQEGTVRVRVIRDHKPSKATKVDLVVAKPRKGEPDSPILTRCSVCTHKRRAQMLCVVNGLGYCGTHYRAHPEHDQIDPAFPIRDQVRRDEDGRIILRSEEDRATGYKTILLAGGETRRWVRHREPTTQREMDRRIERLYAGEAGKSDIGAPITIIGHDMPRRITRKRRAPFTVVIPMKIVMTEQDVADPLMIPLRVDAEDLRIEVAMPQRNVAPASAPSECSGGPETHLLAAFDSEVIETAPEPASPTEVDDRTAKGTKKGESIFLNASALPKQKIGDETVRKVSNARCVYCGAVFIPRGLMQLKGWTRQFDEMRLDGKLPVPYMPFWEYGPSKTRQRVLPSREQRVIPPPARTTVSPEFPSLRINVGKAELDVESNVIIIGGARPHTYESGGFFRVEERVMIRRPPSDQIVTKAPSGPLERWSWRLVWRSDWETWGDVTDSVRQRILGMAGDGFFPMGTGPDDPLPCLFPPVQSEGNPNAARTARRTDWYSTTCPECGCSCGHKEHHRNHHPIRPSPFSFDRNFWDPAVMSTPAKIEMVGHRSDRADMAAHMREQEGKRRMFIRLTQAFHEAEQQAHEEIYESSPDEVPKTAGVRDETKDDVKEQLVRIWEEVFGNSTSSLAIAERGGAVGIATGALDYLPKHTRHNLIAASAIIAFFNRHGNLEDTGGQWRETQRAILKVAGVSGGDFHEVYREVIDRERIGIAHGPEMETELREEEEYYRSWGFEDGKPPVPRVRPKSRSRGTAR